MIMVDKETRKFFFDKEDESKKIWDVCYPECKGLHAVSFDKKTILFLFEDYPHNFTQEQKTLFDKENPYWADFFKGRK